MNSNPSAFFWEWLDFNVPRTGIHDDIVEAGKLARKLTADAARVGYSLEAMGLGTSSVATMIMKALAMKPDDRPTMPTSGRPCFPT